MSYFIHIVSEILSYVCDRDIAARAMNENHLIAITELSDVEDYIIDQDLSLIENYFTLDAWSALKDQGR